MYRNSPAYVEEDGRCAVDRRMGKRGEIYVNNLRVRQRMERKDFRSSPAQGYASESRLGRRVNRATTFSGIQASRREVKERKTICKKVSINNVPRS